MCLNRENLRIREPTAGPKKEWITFMREPPLVSIITPSLNQASYLEAAIRSVLAQDYPSIEYIIIDGGSTDGSQDIIRRFEERLAYWESSSDSGQADAINKGLSRANGEFLAWLNSDDILLPGAVSAAAAALQAAPEAGLVHAHAIGLDADGETIGVQRSLCRSLLDLLSMITLKQPTVFVRRSLWNRAGGLDPSYHYLLDHHLWIRIACLAPMLFVDQYWAGMRYHSESKSCSQQTGFIQESERLGREITTLPEVSVLLRQHHRRIQSGRMIFRSIYQLQDDRSLSALGNLLGASLLSPTSLARTWKLLPLAFLRLLRIRFLERFLGKARFWLQGQHRIP